MDRTEASALLGLEPTGFTLEELRSARNASLQAHHPDKAGVDPTATRRSTYWAARINEAYAALEPFARRTAPDQPGGTRQSFDAAARRAAARTQGPDPSPDPSAQPGPPPPPAAGGTTGPFSPGWAQQPPPPPATASRTPQRTAPSTPGPSARRRGLVPTGTGARLGVAGVAVAVVVGLPVLVGASGRLGPATGPSASSVATATPGDTSAPATAPAATRAPEDQATQFYTWFNSLDGRYLQPCFDGTAGCAPSTPITYADSAGGAFDAEVTRIYALIDDGGAPSFDKPVCREERGSLFAQMTAFRARIQLLDLLATVEPGAQSIEPSLVAWEPCDNSLSYEDRRARAREITATIKAATEAVASVASDRPRGELDQLRTDGDRLIRVGLDLARRGARDASFEDVASGTPEWRDIRTVAADMVTLGVYLRDPTAARSDASGTALDAITKALDAVTKANAAKAWH